MWLTLIGDLCNVPSIQDNQWVCVSIIQNMMGWQLGYQEGLVLLLIRLSFLLNRSYSANCGVVCAV